MINMNFEQILNLIQWLVVIIAMFLLHRSVPAQQVEQLLKQLQTTVKKTETPIDDLLLDVATLLNDVRGRMATADNGVSLPDNIEVNPPESGA